jgi:hypothetical protein
MKRMLLCFILVILLMPGITACGGDKPNVTATESEIPMIAKVRIWLTIDGKSDSQPVTVLTPEQTVQATIWAKGITEENITFKVNLDYNGKLTTLANNVRTEGSGKVISIGGFANPLELGKYIFGAYTGAFGTPIGSLEINVVSSLPPTASAVPTAQTTTAAAPSIAPSTTPISALSEQPDMATFRKYFADMGLGKTPADAKGPQDIQQNVATFIAGDYITLYGTVIQAVQISGRYFNVATMNSVNAPAPPMPLQLGGFASSSSLYLSPGKYEYKVYVGDILVAVFPFEVR